MVPQNNVVSILCYYLSILYFVLCLRATVIIVTVGWAFLTTGGVDCQKGT